MAAAEDYDLWLRILVDHEVGLLDDPLVTRRGGHPDQLSATTPAIDRFRILAVTKLLCDERLDSQRRLATTDVLIEKCRIYAAGLARRGRIDAARLYEWVVDHAERWQTGAVPEIGCAVESMRPRCARFHMKADEIDAEIRIIAAQRRLTKTHLERWLAMDDASRGALLDARAQAAAPNRTNRERA